MLACCGSAHAASVCYARGSPAQAGWLPGSKDDARCAKFQACRSTPHFHPSSTAPQAAPSTPPARWAPPSCPAPGLVGGLSAERELLSTQRLVTTELGRIKESTHTSCSPAPPLRSHPPVAGSFWVMVIGPFIGAILAGGQPPTPTHMHCYPARLLLGGARLGGFATAATAACCASQCGPLHAAP